MDKLIELLKSLVKPLNLSAESVEIDPAKAKPEDVAKIITDAFNASRTADAAKITELTAAKAAADAKIVELGKGSGKSDPIELSADVADMLTEAIGDKVDGLVEKGKITPAAASKLKPLLTGGAVMLSKTANGGQRSRAAAILDALAENVAIDLSQKSGPQNANVVDLATHVHGKPEQAVDPDLAARAEQAYGKPVAAK